MPVMGVTLPAPVKAFVEAEAKRLQISQAAVIVQTITRTPAYERWAYERSQDEHKREDKQHHPRADSSTG